MGGKSARRLAKRGWQTMTESTSIVDGTGAVRPVPDGERWFANDLYSACLRRIRRKCATCDGGGVVTEDVSLDDIACPDCPPRDAPGDDWRGDGIDHDAPALLHISYHRRDRKPARDWRHTQCIKNDIVGDDAEMVEMYPAENRLVDTANEYHLWGLEGVPLLAFGFNEGRIVDDGERAADAPGAVQRPTPRGTVKT